MLKQKIDLIKIQFPRTVHVMQNIRYSVACQTQVRKWYNITKFYHSHFSLARFENNFQITAII